MSAYIIKRFRPEDPLARHIVGVVLTGWQDADVILAKLIIQNGGDGYTFVREHVCVLTPENCEE